MARNCEKQYGKLNRLILQKEKEELLQKRPKRPRLSQLNSANEIKKWLPSIKQDIEFNLVQSEVVCYSDAKILELQNEVQKLEKEYKSFVHKLRQLDPTTTQTPWNNRPYERKNSKTEEIKLNTEISTPILDQEEAEVDVDIVTNYNSSTMDIPLEFSTAFPPPKKRKLNSVRETNEHFEEKHGEAVKEKTCILQKMFGLESDDEKPKNSILGLNYSSSDEDT